MSLILTVYNTPDWKMLADVSNLPLITDAPLAIAVGDALLQPVQPLSAVPALLLQLPAGQSLWLAAVQAEYFLANAIESGSDLKGAAVQWEQQTNALLTLQSQKRRQLKLFNLHQALAQPNAFRESLSAAMTINDYPPQPAENNLALLAACQYVAQQPVLQALNVRLHASLLPLGENTAPLLDIDLILQRHRAKAAQLTATSKERNLLLEQQSDMQQQLDRVTTECSELHQVKQQGEANLKATSDERDLILSQLQQVQEKLEREGQASVTQLANISDERDQLERQLSSMQQQLEREGQASAAQLAALSDERDQLQRELAGAQQQLEQSSAERKKLIQAQQQSESNWKATSEERDLILSQLHQVQERLEHYNATLQAEQRNNEQSILALQAEHKHALLAHDKQQARDIAKLESELRRTKARAESAEYAGGLLQQEIAELRGSTLWRATGPARVLGRLIRKTDKIREKSLRDISLLLSSEYFDIAWYSYTYPDVAESNLNPAEHYLLYGAAEGRLPGPLFDGNWYLQQYPDVAAAGTNPLLHFIMFGQQEGRSSSPKLLTNDSPSAEE